MEPVDAYGLYGAYGIAAAGKLLQERRQRAFARGRRAGQECDDAAALIFMQFG
jgi:hypothetical protein